jgi:hypothetical protein
VRCIEDFLSHDLTPIIRNVSCSTNLWDGEQMVLPPIIAVLAVYLTLTDPDACCVPSAWNNDYSGAIMSGRELPEQVIFGDYTIFLEQTSLAEVAERFGGAITHTGDASASFRWVCYTARNGRAWIGSSGPMGGPDWLVTQIQVVAGQFPADSGCPNVEADITGFGAISLGDPASGVEAVFGGNFRDDQAEVQYRTETAVEPEGCTVSRYMSVEFAADTVAGLSVARITSC